MIKGGNKPIDVRPSQGGRLMSGSAADSVGVANYVEKLDFRRLLDREVRSEGHDVFAPAPSVNVQQQCVVSADDVLLTFEARLPSGVRSYIAATATTIYALDTIDNGGYFEDESDPPDDTDPYFDSEYFATHQSEWRIVGSGFSPDTMHWQASLIDGYVVLNNAIDLPVTYRAGDLAVEPIYELRELGVASVAWMTDFSGHAMCLGVRQISEEDLDALMTPLTGTFTQVGATMSSGKAVVTKPGADVIATLAGEFTADHVGRTIRFLNGYSGEIASQDGDSCVITGGPSGYTFPFTLPFIISADDSFTLTSSTSLFTEDMVGQEVWVGARRRTIVSVESDTSCTVDFDGPMSGVGIITANMSKRWEGPVSNYSYRVLWSNPAKPRSYAASGYCAIGSGSTTLTLTRPMRSIVSGSEIFVSGAGVDGGVLEATVLRVVRGGTELQLDTAASTAVTEDDGVVMLKSNFGSPSSYFDIQDDGSPIIAALKNKASLVIYRETSIFTCVATQRTAPNDPFSFRLEYGGSLPDDRSLCLRYPSTLVAVGDASHVYCGANDICAFDANTRRPSVVENLRFSSGPVFKAIEAGERVFSCNNELTSEVWISVPARELVLRLDYRTQGFTASTSNIRVTSGNSMDRPPVTDVPRERWFVMGIGGVLAVYGLTDAKDVVTSATGVQSGVACSADSAVFQPYHVGRSIVFDSGEVSLITGYTSSVSVSVSPSREVTETGFKIIPMNWARFRCGYTSRLRSGMNSFVTSRDDQRLTGYGVVFDSCAVPNSGATRVSEIVLEYPDVGIPIWLNLDADGAVLIDGMATPADYVFESGFITFTEGGLADGAASVTIEATVADLAPALRYIISTKAKLNSPKAVKVSKQFALDTQWMPSHVMGRYIEDAVEVTGASAMAEISARTYEIRTARAGGIGAVTHGV